MVTLTTALFCAATIFINTSGFDWNENDQKAINRATYVCGNDDRYEKFRCTKSFTKTEERVFRVICGVSE